MTDIFGEVYEYIILLKPTIILTLIATGIVFFLFLMITVIFSWKGRNLKLMGYFYGIGTRDLMVLTLLTLKFLFAAVWPFDGTEIDQIHLYIFLILEFLFICIRRKIIAVPVGLLNRAFILGLLYLDDFIQSYMNAVQSTAQLRAVVICLKVFIVLYTAFDWMWEISKEAGEYSKGLKTDEA